LKAPHKGHAKKNPAKAAAPQKELADRLVETVETDPRRVRA
jgi:hypothetical protein